MSTAAALNAATIVLFCGALFAFRKGIHLCVCIGLFAAAMGCVTGHGLITSSHAWIFADAMALVSVTLLWRSLRAARAVEAAMRTGAATPARKKSTYVAFAARRRGFWALHVYGPGIPGGTVVSQRRRHARGVVRRYVALRTGAAPGSFRVMLAVTSYKRRPRSELAAIRAQRSGRTS